MARSIQDTFLWHLKVRLQFSGWLQYLINAVAALVFLFLAAIGLLIRALPGLFFWPFLVIGSLLLLNTIFDLCVLKLGIRPRERHPRRRDHLDAFELMRSRRSCRSFQKRNLTPEDHAEIMEQVRLYSQQSRQIGTKPVRFEYVAAPLTVWPTVGGHEFLVAIAPREYDRLATIDVGRSLQKVVLRATRMGVATCWIGPGADQKSVALQLGDRFNPEEDHIICVCALGYASKFLPLFVRFMQFGQHRRLPLSSLFFAGPQFQTPLELKSSPFKEFGRCYEVCQWSPSSYNGQTTRCAAVMEGANGERVLARFDFGASTHSRYYAAVALGIWCANWETGCEALGIPGHFTVLTPDQRGDGEPQELPRYDVSWVPETTLHEGTERAEF